MNVKQRALEKLRRCQVKVIRPGQVAQWMTANVLQPGDVLSVNGEWYYVRESGTFTRLDRPPAVPQNMDVTVRVHP